MTAVPGRPLAGRQLVPTNWDPALLPRLLAAAPGFRPDYLYGSLPGDATLRSPLDLPPATEDDVEAQVAAAREHGIGFVYVMNATSGTRELTERGRFELLQRLAWLEAVGAAGVVVANPLVMELVRRFHPGLELHVSVLAGTATVNTARWFERVGAAVIHLAPDANRQIPLLRSLRKAVGCRLSVLANEGCLFQCPLRRYHADVMSNAAETIACGAYADFPYYACSHAKAADPAEIVRAPWVRPQDVGVYEEIGIDHIKLAGREKLGGGPHSHTDWIVRVSSAYALGRGGDLAELLIALEPPQGLDGSPAAGAGRGGGRDGWRVSIDSDRLDGFLDYFAAGRCDQECYHCGWCGEFARRAVTVHGDRERHVAALAATVERLRTGDYRTREGAGGAGAPGGPGV